MGDLCLVERLESTQIVADADQSDALRIQLPLTFFYQSGVVCAEKTGQCAPVGVAGIVDATTPRANEPDPGRDGERDGSSVRGARMGA